MKENIVKDKSFEFALHIVKLYKHLVENKKEYVLSKRSTLFRHGHIFNCPLSTVN
jgi:hypothetical protein